jgi:hypothetical protein
MVPELVVLSITMPLVPPDAARAEVAITPRFFQLTRLSTVVAPAVVLQAGVEPPELPAVVTN